MLLQGKLMPKSHSTNDLIIALVVVVRMTPKHQTNWIFLPSWVKVSFIFLVRLSFLSQELYIYIFTNLYQRTASWPELLFPKCSVLDCSILNPFSKCVFVLSRIVRETHLPYLRKETLGCIQGCELGKRKDIGEVLSPSCHQGREQGLTDLT